MRRRKQRDVRSLSLYPRRQSGQAIVLVALMIIVLFGGVGLAVDSGIGSHGHAAAEGAAVAGALSGVIFMPGQQFSGQAQPGGSGNDATDRAIAEAKKNGFDTSNTADNVQVTVAAVPGFSNPRD